MSNCDIFCICKSPSGKRCPYRAVNKDTNMCGVHHLFKDDLTNLNKCFPNTFNNHI